jgi:hypothetical protein
MSASNQINAMVPFGVAGGIGGTATLMIDNGNSFATFRRPGEREPGNFHTARPRNWTGGRAQL